MGRSYKDHRSVWKKVVNRNGQPGCLPGVDMSFYTAADGQRCAWNPKIVILHESGHAVVSHRLGVRVTSVSIHGSGDPELERREMDGACLNYLAATAADNLVIGLAGVFAACLLGYARSPNENDINSVGFLDDLNNIKVFHASDPSITDDVMTAVKEQTKTLVLDNERDIRKVARALWKKKILNEDDIVAMLGARTQDNVMSADQQEELVRKGLLVIAA